MLEQEDGSPSIIVVEQGLSNVLYMRALHERIVVAVSTSHPKYRQLPCWEAFLSRGKKTLGLYWNCKLSEHLPECCRLLD